MTGIGDGIFSIRGSILVILCSIESRYVSSCKLFNSNRVRDSANVFKPFRSGDETGNLSDGPGLMGKLMET
jgi:hypothetical protein